MERKIELDNVNIVESEGDAKSEVKIYSVEQITNYIKSLIKSDKSLQDIWVSGEILNFRHHNHTHMYFSLKDANSDFIIECVMYKNANQDLEFMPESGIKVVIRGYIDVYKSKYQIVAKEIHLEGKGELYFKFLQIREKLQKEGLFNEEHKKPIPKYPKAIGVITSLEGAVIHDITKVIRNKYPHVEIIIYPSSVQGKEAKDMIVNGIKVLNTLIIDVIIIARGGGSFEELWPFNEEIVARAIYNSKIPVVSAIGHESDVTIADFAADRRAPTPSIAAEIVVPSEKEILKFLKDLENSLLSQTKNILGNKKQLIQQITSRLLFKKPFNLIESYKAEFKNANERLRALNPYAVLNRGYSITTKNDKIISSIKDINNGDIISTVVRDGKINSKVRNKDERKII